MLKYTYTLGRNEQVNVPELPWTAMWSAKQPRSLPTGSTAMDWPRTRDPEEVAESEQVISQAVTDANLAKQFKDA